MKRIASLVLATTVAFAAMACGADEGNDDGAEPDSPGNGDDSKPSGPGGDKPSNPGDKLEDVPAGTATSSAPARAWTMIVGMSVSESGGLLERVTTSQPLQLAGCDDGRRRVSTEDGHDGSFAKQF